MCYEVRNTTNQVVVLRHTVGWDEGPCVDGGLDRSGDGVATTGGTTDGIHGRPGRYDAAKWLNMLINCAGDTTGAGRVLR